MSSVSSRRSNARSRPFSKRFWKNSDTSEQSGAAVDTEEDEEAPRGEEGDVTDATVESVSSDNDSADVT